MGNGRQILVPLRESENKVKSSIIVVFFGDSYLLITITKYIYALGRSKPDILALVMNTQPVSQAPRN